ncbi:MAG: hypothetical protein U9R50_12935 [Campylobacterota bacterium]|nr:hypothetical protein [Campylobacterota bacterium]
MLKLDSANKTFKELNINIKSSFYNIKEIDSPVLKCVTIFLNAIGEGGLKLTAKGNLPTKLVEQLAKTQPTAHDERFIKFAKRFIEEEQPAAMRARVVSEVAKLTRKQSNKLLLTKKGREFLNSSKPEQFVYIFHTFLNLNLGYFDRYQDASFINGISAIMLQLVRDKAKQPRGSDVYCSLLLNQYDQVNDLIDEQLYQESILDDDMFELFIKIVDLRHFGNFFAPMGFVKDIKNASLEPYSYEKTLLLDQFFESVNEIDTTKILDASTIKLLSNRVKDENLEIDLFNDLCFLFSSYVSVPPPPPELLANDMVEQKRLLGSAKDVQLEFYTELCGYIDVTMRQFTELDAVGSRDDLMNKYKSLVDGFFLLLPKSTPHNLFVMMQSITYYLIEMLDSKYNLKLSDENFYDNCVEKLNSELAEDIGAVFYLMGELHKYTKKLKKIKPVIVELTKEIIHSYILVLLELRSHNEDLV